MTFGLSEVEWAAIGAIAGVVAALAGVALLFPPVVQWRRYRRLNAILRSERKRHPANDDMRRILENPPKDRGYQLENMKERTGWYLHDVRQGIDGLAKIIPEGERLMVRSKLRHLLMELRVTHKTLAESLALFDTTDAERFFRDFDKFATDFGTVYASNVVASTARTHCSDIIDLISQITSTIPERTPGRQEIEELGHSVVVSDDDVIVPVMHSLLEGTRKVIDSIRQSIQDDKQRQAIVEKEQYRAEIQPIYETLRKTLDKMDEAARRF